MMKMNVLSVFDGIAVTREALGDKCKLYYASEIEQAACSIALANHPDIVHVGDIRALSKKTVPEKIDLLAGGSPCQDLSCMNSTREGLKGEKSGLFYEYVRVKNLFKPTWFIFENVASMPSEARDEISKQLGVQPISLNAARVSAQERVRLFWTNIPVRGLPPDRGQTVLNILDPKITDTIDRKTFQAKSKKPGRTGIISVGAIKGVTWTSAGRVYSAKGKAPTLLRDIRNCGLCLLPNGKIRHLSVGECCQLQGLPSSYCDSASKRDGYAALGNAFNADLIRWIVDAIPNQKPQAPPRTFAEIGVQTDETSAPDGLNGPREKKRRRG